MKQNKFSLFILLFASVSLLNGCARDERNLWIQRQVAQKELDKKILKNRTPAQNAPRCFIDRFQDTLIRQEVQQMESTYADGKRGSYRHGDMQFDDLSQATIDLLKNDYVLDATVADSKTWTAVSPKQKDCKDYSCFVGSLYSNPTNEGLLHYWYFLKTGYPISALKAYTWYIEGQHSTRIADGYPLEKYLFDKDEWKAFWLATNLLPKSMLHLPSINVIHRLPHGFIPDSWKTKGTCGWAVGLWNEGEILFSDECLTLYKNDLFDHTAYFYQSTTHELAHRFSAWNFATKAAPAKKMDEEDEFMALSGWTIERLAQPNGTFKQFWKSRGDVTDWASDYSKSSPAEDFAETIGSFRSDPWTLFKKAPSKYQYAKRKVFGGKGYTNDDLQAQYANDLENVVIDQVDTWIAPCLNGQGGAILTQKQQTLLKMIEIKLAIDDKVKGCIQNQVVSTVLSQLDQIRFNEPEGCKTLDNFEGVITNTALSNLTPKLNEYLKGKDQLVDLVGGVAEFRKALLQEFDGRALVLSCAQEKNPSGCYEVKLNAEFDRLYQLHKVLLSISAGDMSEMERKRFAAANAYDRVYDQVVQFYESLFSGYKDEMKSRAEQIWQACLMVPSRVNTDVLLEPYSAGNQYVSPAIIQCINEKIPGEMNAIRSLAGDGQGVKIFSPEAKSWVIQRILLPAFKRVLDAKVIDANKAELETLQSTKQPALDVAFQNLTQDLTWKKSDLYSFTECKAAVNPVLQEQLKASTYRFTAVDPVIDDLGNQVCEKVRAWIDANAKNTSNQSPTVTNAPVVPQTPPVPTDSQKQELDPIWKKLRPLMVAEAQTRFYHCRSRVYFIARLKRACLFTEWVVDDQDQYRKTGWGWARDRSIRKWITDADVKAFIASKAYTEEQIFEVARARADEESQDFVNAILNAFYGGTPTADTSDQ